ncbi:hypothetical protein BHE74_00038241 [Ensete ventricosum]|nr:hypothetical protein BHE74_00038241 [Ensete ventricosum]
MPPGFRLYQAAEAKGVEDQVDEPPQVGQEEEQGEEELRELRIADGEPHFGAEESQRCMRWERSGTEAEDESHTRAVLHGRDEQKLMTMICLPRSSISSASALGTVDGVKGGGRLAVLMAAATR